MDPWVHWIQHSMVYAYTVVIGSHHHVISDLTGEKYYVKSIIVQTFKSIVRALTYKLKNTMNIIRSWREQKIMLKWKFPFLNDDDFAHKEGKEESMLAKLSARIKITRSELDSLLADLQRF